MKRLAIFSVKIISLYLSELIVLNDAVPNVGINFKSYRRKELLFDTHAVCVT